MNSTRKTHWKNLSRLFPIKVWVAIFITISPLLCLRIPLLSQSGWIPEGFVNLTCFSHLSGESNSNIKTSLAIVIRWLILNKEPNPFAQADCFPWHALPVQVTLVCLSCCHPWPRLLGYKAMFRFVGTHVQKIFNSSFLLGYLKIIPPCLPGPELKKFNIKDMWWLSWLINKGIIRRWSVNAPLPLHTINQHQFIVVRLFIYCHHTPIAFCMEITMIHLTHIITMYIS